MTDILLLGEAWGEHEERARQAFVGYTGNLLNQLLSAAGIDRRECFVTNVFNLRPPGNDIEALCGPKSSAIPGYPPLFSGKYVRREFTAELNRLAQDISANGPNVIVCLGNTPLWALSGKTGISKYRGTTGLSTHTAIGYKYLPTFHPSYIIRGQWNQRPIVIADLIKAKNESTSPDVVRPVREIWIDPTLEDLDDFRSQYIQIPGRLSVDIETVRDIISCVGIAPSQHHCLVVPFIDRRRPRSLYWPTESDALRAWRFIKSLLEDRRLSKTFQNGLFDITFIYRTTGIKTLSADHDTMLLHHALQPEMMKGLGFLGSVYTDEGAWKQLRGRATTIKREE